MISILHRCCMPTGFHVSFSTLVKVCISTIRFRDESTLNTPCHWLGEQHTVFTESSFQMAGIRQPWEISGNHRVWFSGLSKRSTLSITRVYSCVISYLCNIRKNGSKKWGSFSNQVFAPPCIFFLATPMATGQPI